MPLPLPFPPPPLKNIYQFSEDTMELIKNSSLIICVPYSSLPYILTGLTLILILILLSINDESFLKSAFINFKLNCWMIPVFPHNYGRLPSNIFVWHSIRLLTWWHNCTLSRLLAAMCFPTHLCWYTCGQHSQFCCWKPTPSVQKTLTHFL